MNTNPKNTTPERYIIISIQRREIFFYCILKETEFDMRIESPIYANEVINIQYDACLILSPSSSAVKRACCPVTICRQISNEIVLTFIPSKSNRI